MDTLIGFRQSPLFVVIWIKKDVLIFLLGSSKITIIVKLDVLLFWYLSQTCVLLKHNQKIQLYFFVLQVILRFEDSFTATISFSFLLPHSHNKTRGSEIIKHLLYIKKHIFFVQVCCVFWRAFGCCAHPKAGRNLEKALKWTKKVEKRLKKGFDQLLGARSNRKLVEIHNISPY